MQTFIQGAMVLQNHIQLVPIFGHSSKGLVGLDVIGAGKMGRQLKEKMIYLSKKCVPKIPLRRYVICFDGGLEFADKKVWEDARWLELPALILFWQICGLLPIHQLEECLCAGKINVDGKIEVPQWGLLSSLLLPVPGPLKLISLSQGMAANEAFPCLPLEELLANFPGITLCCGSARAVASPLQFSMDKIQVAE